ncbi:MAG: ADOP family duplicated permease [Acidobacteriota bacterium]
MFRTVRSWIVRVAGVFGSGRRDDDLAEEIAAHLELHAADHERTGMRPEEARRQAALAFGGVESVKEQYRDQRSLPWVDKTLQDVRYAFRSFRRNPGFALAAIVVLALGIGANTAMFTMVNAVLLKPLPFREPDRLVMVWHVPPAASFPGMKEFAVSPANYFDWKRQQHVFDHMAIGQFRSHTLTGRGEAEQLRASGVSTEFFDTLGVQPIHGRAFLPEEDEPGRDHVVVLGYKLWQVRFGADPAIVGRKIVLDGSPYTVVGVMGPQVVFPEWAQMWTPLGWTAEKRQIRSNHNCLVVGRLRTGVSLDKAQAEMSTISARLELQYPEDDKGWGAVVKPFREDLVGDLRASLLVLLGAVGFVLLIACANVANLVLVRTLARKRELAVRLALGASPWRVVRQVLTETTLLALLGGAVGIFVADGGVQLITAFFGDRLPQALPVHADARVFAFTAVVALLTGLAAGLAPALRLSRANVVDGIKQGGGRADSETGSARLRALLVVAEVGLSLVLLVGAGLMMRSLWELRGVDAGFDPANVLIADVPLSEPRYPKPGQQWRFFESVLARIRALPGVESAGLVTNLPLADGGNSWPVAIVGRPQLPLSEQPQVQGNIITPGYLSALRIGLTRGRDINENDREGRTPVVLVSEAMARWLWPGQDPIGQHFTVGFFPGKVWEVVGIVKDVKERGLAKEGTASLYMPFAQNPAPFGTLVIRTRTSLPAALSSAVTAAVHEIDPDQPLDNVMPMNAVVARSMADKRLTMLLLGAFAALALVLSAVGIYSVLAYAVRRRMREIGIRMALGADRPGVIRMVLSDALKPTLAGVGLGIIGAVAIRKVIASLLFGVGPGDPVTFAAVATLLLIVALAASALPAYRAAQVDPVTPMRDE